MTGRKSFARVMKEDLIGETIGHYPHLVENEVAKDDLLGVVLGEDKNGYVRCFRLGPCPSDVWGEEITRNRALRMLQVSQSNENALNNKLSKMEEKMEKLLDRVNYLEKKGKKACIKIETFVR